MTFSKIYKENWQYVYNYVLAKCKNAANAEDIVENTFIKFYRLESAKYYESKSSIKTWLCRMAGQQLIDMYRNKNQKKSNLFVTGLNEEGKDNNNFVAPSSYNTNEMVENNELKAKIYGSFRSLSKKNRKLAIYFFLNDRTYEEISEIMDIPLGTVKGTISRIRQILQCKLKGVYSL